MTRYRLTVEATDDRPVKQSLGMALKVMLRTFGLRCVDVRPAEGGMGVNSLASHGPLPTVPPHAGAARFQSRNLPPESEVRP